MAHKEIAWKADADYAQFADKIVNELMIMENWQSVAAFQIVFAFISIGRCWSPSQQRQSAKQRRTFCWSDRHEITFLARRYLLESAPNSVLAESFHFEINSRLPPL